MRVRQPLRFSAAMSTAPWPMRPEEAAAGGVDDDEAAARMRRSRARCHEARARAAQAEAQTKAQRACPPVRSASSRLGDPTAGVEHERATDLHPADAFHFAAGGRGNSPRALDPDPVLDGEEPVAAGPHCARDGCGGLLLSSLGAGGALGAVAVLPSSMSFFGNAPHTGRPDPFAVPRVSCGKPSLRSRSAVERGSASGGGGGDQAVPLLGSAFWSGSSPNSLRHSRAPRLAGPSRRLARIFASDTRRIIAELGGTRRRPALRLVPAVEAIAAALVRAGASALSSAAFFASAAMLAFHVAGSCGENSPCSTTKIIPS